MQKYQVIAILYIIYDYLIIEHWDLRSMNQKIQQVYYWKIIYEDCKKYVKIYRVY